MLKVLEIENIAVIEKAAVQFDTGLNVLTGETGAGKSIDEFLPRAKAAARSTVRPVR